MQAHTCVKATWDVPAAGWNPLFDRWAGIGALVVPYWRRFPRKVVVGTLGVIYNLGGEDESTGLRDSLRQATWDGTDQRVFTVPVALSIMVFFAVCARCFHSGNYSS